MPRPTLYYIRHGQTDWNISGQLQGRNDQPLNAHGEQQARQSGEILRDLLVRDSINPADLSYVSSPLSRARETMALVRPILGLPADGYAIEEQLTEIAFGEWEGFTIAQLHERDPARIAQREHDKWSFVAPGGESYKHVSERVGRWYASLERDTVATAHGGTARGLMAYLGIATPAAAPLAEIAQGVVYVFQDDRMTRYA